MKMNIAILNRAGRWFGRGYMMKPSNLFRRLAGSLPGVLLLCLLAANGRAQTFTTLHTFTGGSDGSTPVGGLILSGNTLYGPAELGGDSGYGTVFAINTDGTGFYLLKSFNGVNNEAYPCNLLLSGNTLYGGSLGQGVTIGALFAVNTNGTGFTTLHMFNNISAPHYTNSDGGEVFGQLILSGNTLYGASSVGGTGGSGNVFAVNTNGTGLTILHNFTAPSTAFNPLAGTVLPPNTNSDGAFPNDGVILSGDTLYGTTGCGGSWGWGTVFAVSTNGTGFTNLYSFTGGSDGALPFAGLISSGNTLYGTACWGGTNRSGTVFALNTDGTGFAVLHVFTATNIPYSVTLPPPSKTNSDGAWPIGGLILSGNTLYGTTWMGGSSGHGTVFALNTDGTGFTTLHCFTGGKDGANPQAALILSGNTLYGMARYGGTYNDGTVFSLSFPPQLAIIPSETNVILTWPTNYAGFDYTGYTLESTTNLGSSAVWSTNSPAPVIVNGQNTVTNPISGSQTFFRLSQ
jgi:uncharacterized repeat protein (TIGR03803 family)